MDVSENIFEFYVSIFKYDLNENIQSFIFSRIERTKSTISN